jgi:hypothetical protein
LPSSGRQPQITAVVNHEAVGVGGVDSSGKRVEELAEEFVAFNQPSPGVANEVREAVGGRGGGSMIRRAVLR